jgi:hypothetical protein
MLENRVCRVNGNTGIYFFWPIPLKRVSKVVVVLKLHVYTGNWPVNKQDWLPFLSKQIRLATFYFLAKNETLCTN